MSEYQYYEFAAVDRPLDDRQVAELRALSTRADITSTSFVNTYHWGSFRGDPRVMVQRYFDAFLYLANWGTHELMLRLPARLLDLDTARRYCMADTVSSWASGGNVVLHAAFQDESGEYWDDESGEGALASILPVRAEIMSGDPRALYLLWLVGVQAEQLDDDEFEPPVPAGLAALTGSQTALADFLRLDSDLIAAADESSDQALPQAGDRTVVELLSVAAIRRNARLAAVRVRREVAAAEQAVAVAAARERRLGALRTEGEGVWRRVAALVATKKPAEYDRAVDLLLDLREVCVEEEVSRGISELRDEHGRKPSLMDRLDQAGL